jgi:hypothetical protein
MVDPLESEIVSTFDTLVAEGVIYSGPYEAVEHEDEGYPVRKRGSIRCHRRLLIAQYFRSRSEYVHCSWSSRALLGQRLTPQSATVANGVPAATCSYPTSASFSRS